MTPTRNTTTTARHTSHSLRFIGAAREVTGSCHLLNINGSNILFDCGLQQGHRAKVHPIEAPLSFNPADIDVVLLSHAHLDHSGMLPRLVRVGFRGTVHCTPDTLKLLDVMLRDAFHIYCKDLEQDNRQRLRAGKPLLQPAYSEHDIKTALKLCRTNEYNTVFSIGDNMTAQFLDAGHILGSAITEVRIQHGGQHTVLVYSGDLGNNDTPLMNDPALLSQADIVLMESTYGNRNHRSQDETVVELIDIIKTAEAQNGNILIPAFAVGRTQELIFQLGKLYHQGLLRNWAVFLDSPMAKSITDIYSHALAHLAPDDTALLRKHNSRSLADFLPNLNITESPEESVNLNRIKSGAIIIAGSGMCNGGRIRHHLKHRLWHANTHLVFAGFQAAGSLGRILINRPRNIKLFGQTISVKAAVHTLGGFSAHADQQQLLHWASQFKSRPHFYLVHGEDTALTVLQEQLQQQGHHCSIAEPGQVISL